MSEDRIDSALEVTSFPVSALVPFHRNPRRGDVSAIAESLKARGQYRPIVVNLGTKTGRLNEILAGNHTWMAAQKIGWTEIQATTVDVDDEVASAIVVADNRLADIGGYDDRVLAELVASLDDPSGIGFTGSELKEILAGLDERPQLTDPDAMPDTPELEGCISREGDIWQLGDSTLVCGSATDLDLLEKAAAGRLADCVWTDPPYGVKYVGGTADSLTIQNDGSEEADVLFLEAMRVAPHLTVHGAPIYVAHADTHRVAFEMAMRAVGIQVRENLVWVKQSLVLGHADYQWRHEPILFGSFPEEDGDYYSRHEPILYGMLPAEDGVGRLGRGGPRWHGDNKQTTVFEFDKPSASRIHPTMKPVALVSAMLTNSCPVGGLVFDPFSGSGTTLIAAYDLKMNALCVELDPRYVDATCRRFEEHTGITPVRDGEAVAFAGGA